MSEALKYRPETSLLQDFDEILGDSQDAISINTALGHLDRNLDQGTPIDPDDAANLQQKILRLKGGDRETIGRVLNKLRAVEGTNTQEQTPTTKNEKGGADVISIERGKKIGEAKALADKIIDIYDAQSDDLDSDNQYTRNEAFDKLAKLIHQLKELTVDNNIAIDSGKRQGVEKVRLKLIEKQRQWQQEEVANKQKLEDKKKTEIAEKPNAIKALFNKIRGL